MRSLSSKAVHFLALPMLTIISLQAWATAPTIVSMTGVSNFVATAPATAYGGIAGNVCATTDGITPCNTCQAANLTCASAPLCKCNQAAIYDNLTVHVVLTNPAGTTGQACVAAADGNAAGAKTAVTRVNLNNDSTFVDFKWQNICNKISGISTCANAAAQASSTVAVDIWIAKATGSCSTAPATGDSEIAQVSFKVVNPGADGTFDVYPNPVAGISSFLPYPGDQKVRIESLESAGGFPSLTYGVQAKQVVVFISPTSIDDANYQAPPVTPVLLPVVDNGDNLEQNIVDGLNNDQRYFFRLALLDEANNVVQYFPALDGGVASCKAGATDPQNCPYSAVPSEVLGLLSKDLNCFIATAAYGSTMAPKIQTFRAFRHRYLLTNSWGLAFVKGYYHYGPYAARFIHDKPMVRALVRGALWPLWGFSYLALKLGFAWALATAMMLLMTTVALPLWGVNRRSSK